MVTIEALLDDHRELRRLTAALVELVGDDERLNLDYLGPDVVKRLTALERQLSGSLQAHEEREDQLAAQVVKASGAALGTVFESIRSDHSTMRQVFQVLNALTAMAEAESAYSIRFAVWALADHLERHLSWEEREAFPVFGQLFRVEELEAAAGS